MAWNACKLTTKVRKVSWFTAVIHFLNDVVLISETICSSLKRLVSLLWSLFHAKGGHGLVPSNMKDAAGARESIAYNIAAHLTWTEFHLRGSPRTHLCGKNIQLFILKEEEPKTLSWLTNIHLKAYRLLLKFLLMFLSWYEKFWKWHNGKPWQLMCCWLTWTKILKLKKHKVMEWFQIYVSGLS